MEKKEFMVHHTVPSLEAPCRISDYAVGIFYQIPSRKGIKKAIKSGQLTVDKEKVGTAFQLTGGEIIRLNLLDQPCNPYRFERVNVVYIDDHMVVVNKPPGMLVSGNRHRTLCNILAAQLPMSKLDDALVCPRPVHRLDFATSGLVIFARNYKALISLSNMFEERIIQKTYIALCRGVVPQKGVIEIPIDGKEAITKYECMRVIPSDKYNELSLVKLFPLTGRTHQLRIHLSSIGHPILGDLKYDRSGSTAKGGLFLQAIAVSFPHPALNKTKDFKIEPHKKFKSFL